MKLAMFYILTGFTLIYCLICSLIFLIGAFLIAAGADRYLTKKDDEGDQDV